MLTYFFWIIAGVLALPAIVGLAVGLAVIFVGFLLGAAIIALLCCPLIVWLILADARFWRSLTHGRTENN